MTDDKALLMLSGGIDSVTLAFHARDQGTPVQSAIFFDYGHEASGRELHCARRTCIKIGLAFEPVDLSGLKYLFFGVIPTDFHPMMAECKCSDPTAAHAIAATYAVLSGYSRLLVGVIKEDVELHPGYPDYLSRFSDAISSLYQRQFRIDTPFLAMSKADVMRLGQSLGVDYQETWGCYSGGAAHCGLCHGCEKRLSAFQPIGEVDPAAYFEGLSVRGPSQGIFGG